MVQGFVGAITDFLFGYCRRMYVVLVLEYEIVEKLIFPMSISAAFDEIESSFLLSMVCINMYWLY